MTPAFMGSSMTSYSASRRTLRQPHNGLRHTELRREVTGKPVLEMTGGHPNGYWHYRLPALATQAVKVGYEVIVLANAVVYLASTDSAFIVDTELVIESGIS